MWGLRSFLALALVAGRAEAVEWRVLAPGFELTEVAARAPSAVGDSRITVVRIDPARWRLVLVGPGSGDDASKTAREWARSDGLVLATNAGMFATDHRTHLGYLESEGEVRARPVDAYQSLAAFDPRDPERSAAFAIFDLDVEGVSIASIRRDYRSLVQNLRLIKKPGVNRWSVQPKRWSEAALGEDAQGRILFIHCRSPFAMRELNRELLASGIGLVAAQHLEGGPEAQLYLEVGETAIELVGSFETGFREDDGNSFGWPIPNVLGLRPRD